MTHSISLKTNSLIYVICRTFPIPGSFRGEFTIANNNHYTLLNIHILTQLRKCLEDYLVANAV